MTAVLCAALGGSYEIVEYLLDHGASLEDTNHVRDLEVLSHHLTY
jgi:ankyrin repeat protein